MLTKAEYGETIRRAARLRVALCRSGYIIGGEEGEHDFFDHWRETVMLIGDDDVIAHTDNLGTIEYRERADVSVTRTGIAQELHRIAGNCFWADLVDAENREIDAMHAAEE